MAITLTAAAAQQIRAQLAKHGSGLGLRVGVKPVGCSGLTYTYDIAETPQAGDKVFEQFDAKLFVNAQALSSLDGSTLDYVSEGMKRAFQFDNPNVSSTCGCGESFNLKAGSTPGVGV